MVFIALRITSRTWKADPALKAIAEHYVLKKNSISQLIRFSDVFKDRFERHCKNVENNPASAKRVKDLASCKHRFNSHSKPFGRMVLYFDAVLRTAQQIHDERKNTAPGKYAAEFLTGVTVESALQLAMLADAGDENECLVRYPGR